MKAITRMGGIHVMKENMGGSSYLKGKEMGSSRMVNIG